MSDSLKTLETVVGLLGNRWYCVVGGYAVDGYVGRLTRSHHDVDVIILEEDFWEIVETFKKIGRITELFPFKAEVEINGVSVGVGRFKKDQESYWLITMPDHRWPATLLRRKEVALDEVMFKVPSKEFLLSTKLMDKRAKGRKDRFLLERLGANLETAKRYRFDFGRHHLE